MIKTKQVPKKTAAAKCNKTYIRKYFQNFVEYLSVTFFPSPYFLHKKIKKKISVN